eukprot:TRINITY_DN3409_c0_g2_i2.p1 TRINITY_DN3409_c0_g2~~TRINITY_DN3409_c0_g2_i2.p1  ORF type:complete len:348 (+),score=80.61 TRINITY_DN3409_c0_g2_i2:48-1091(+)
MENGCQAHKRTECICGNHTTAGPHLSHHGMHPTQHPGLSIACGVPSVGLTASGTVPVGFNATLTTPSASTIYQVPLSASQLLPQSVRPATPYTASSFGAPVDQGREADSDSEEEATSEHELESETDEGDEETQRLLPSSRWNETTYEPPEEAINPPEQGVYIAMQNLAGNDPPSDEAGTPDGDSPPAKSGKTGAKVAAAAGVAGGVVGGVAVGAAAPAAVVAAVNAAGFAATGIAAGSTAAGLMSASAVASGGGVAAGGAIATLQTIGATGSVAAVAGGPVAVVAVGALVGVVAVGGLCAGVGYGGYKLWQSFGPKQNSNSNSNSNSNNDASNNNTDNGNSTTSGNQ